MSRLSYTEAQAREAIAASVSWAESLRRLDRCPTGGAWRVLKKHAAAWEIPTDHFLPNGRPAARGRTLDEMLIEHSPVRGSKLKERLFRAGLLQRACEMCGQGEIWNGVRMALILDHINGVSDDNRIENLRVVCPNCNATLDTHCGRKLRKPPLDPRDCVRCGVEFQPKYETHKHCSRACGSRHDRTGRPNPQARRVERPPLDVLLDLLKHESYLAVARRFGVSDNAVRKWIRSDGATPPPGRGQLGDDGARRALILLALGMSLDAVARELAVSREAIRDLRRGVSYRHIERPHEFPLRA